MATPPKMDRQVSPSRSRESATSLLPSSPACSSSLSLEQQTTSKPLWAPLETDAPITLAASDSSDEVHVCQLCGCWYETRRGLSSHARAHLRQIGISDSEVKGSPIDFLYQIMADEDLKPINTKQMQPLSVTSPSRPSPKRLWDPTTPSTPPPSKQPKSSETTACILCGEEFGNRKGLASHLRSHLRQIGMIDMLRKSSAIEAVQELVDNGVLEAAYPPNPNSAADSPAALPSVVVSPPAPPQSPFAGQSGTSLPSTSPGPAKSPQLLNRAPKAKKGFRLAVDPLLRKPKPEPMDVEVTAPRETGTSGSPPSQKSFASVVSPKPLTSEGESPPTVLCDFCGQLFDTRKALSCHARAHLRQLGLSWSIKTSPIDLLKEVMIHGEESKRGFGASGPSTSGKGSWTPQGPKRTSEGHQSAESASNTYTSPINYSMKEKSSPARSVTTGGGLLSDRSCELCGFGFENRKALASHARAHLRQLGLVEWRTEGASSPIELLSEMIRRDPARVAAVTRRYRTGDLYIKKSQKASASPSLSTDSDSLHSNSMKPFRHQSEYKSESRKPQGHGDPGLRSPRDIRPLKEKVPPGEESQDSNSQQPSRPGSIPAMLPKPPLTPLVKLVGKIYSLKCRFCEKVFQGPLSVQEQWIVHLQEHILSLGYKGSASPPAAPVAAPALVDPVAV